MVLMCIPSNPVYLCLLVGRDEENSFLSFVINDLILERLTVGPINDLFMVLELVLRSHWLELNVLNPSDWQSNNLWFALTALCCWAQRHFAYSDVAAKKPVGSQEKERKPPLGARGNVWPSSTQDYAGYTSHSLTQKKKKIINMSYVSILQ